MSGSILQINISRGGVPKRAIPEGDVTPLGIAGDIQAHPEFHGGLRQALLLISAEGTEELIELGFPLFHGALGENITTRGLDRRLWRIGQRWRLGQVVIEFTKVRAPCDALSVYGPLIQRAVYDAKVKSGEPSSPRWGLSGFYAAVIGTGSIRPGDPITLLSEVV
jgi:MOSC domain-containing protein YiiM